MPEEWWTSFEDPALNALVDSALTSNLDLAATWQQFQAARAIVRRQSSFLLPQIDASTRSGISRPQPDFAGGENFQLGLTAAYEVDLWGRIQSGIEAEEFRARASFFDYQAAAMSLSAEISITWYQLLTARNQLELVNQQIQTNEDIMRLIRARFTGGQVRAVDILRQEQLLESTRNQKIFYETDIALLEHQLAVLLGHPPQNELGLREENLPELPPLPETGLPLELIRRRPDVQQAYHLVLAADRDMAQAIRSKYPRLSLSLAGQTRSNSYNNLFREWAYTLGTDLVAPLLYWGRLRAEVDRTEAIKNQLLYQYGQVVLIAFQEVEDALIRERKQLERIEVLERQLDLAKKTNGQLRNEFLNGLTEYLDVLLSLDQEQQLQRELIEARQVQLEIRISLYRALAGDFETERAVAP
ncbi:efflux transporter outer membrane subunit [Autumnicola edwardsiae]|uniref:Efflux transporter outer membrane subunit n=1 Tax=Autumnicola edwardsiae TaxID=3075594 RepID=A0ABU3CUS9_9FLAO|nr:efflux transporter outer membrane subunit [Zunongwangia sp. F297]MDT0650119.1 efflux transporter outer membrane subunit [Zunongwangia sp. F297]